MEKNEINLLDLLVVLAENLKLLILAPLLVGLLAWGAGFLLPKSFSSQAILSLHNANMNANANANANASVNSMLLSTQAAAILVSPLVLDPVIRSLNLSDGKPIQVARKELAERVQALVGKDGLLRLDVTAVTAIEAQTIAKVMIETWLKSTVPGEKDRAELEKRLAFAQTNLESVRRLLDRLTREGVADLGKPLTRGESGVSMIGVGELQSRYFTDVLNISRLLQGLSADVVVQSPTLPTEPYGPRKSLIAVLAALSCGFLLLIWVFLRHAWRIAENSDPELAQQQAKLLAAFGVKVRAK